MNHDLIDCVYAALFGISVIGLVLYWFTRKAERP